MDEPRLESARVRDAPHLAAMSRVLIEHGLRWRYTPDAIGQFIRAEDTEVVVARQGSEIAGFAVMQFLFTQRRAHLVLLAVASECQRSGLGRRLLRWLEVIALRGGITQVQLELRANNRGAYAFYRALGYREAAALPRYYDGREDAVRMACRLGRERRGSLRAR